ncbi:MAG: hypothetical protein NC428_07230 [Clostridium sp.]|nr:hypothetical protein [Clostridium sp.]
MAEYTFEEIKQLLLKSIEADYEAELTLKIGNDNYMIIIYEDKCSFQKCDGGKTGEKYYKTLDELYEANQIDDIILKRDWDKIKEFDCFDFQILGYWK